MHSEFAIPNNASFGLSNPEYPVATESFLSRIEQNAKNIYSNQFIFLDEHGEKATTTFKDFEHRSNAIASWLTKRFQPDERATHSLHCGSKPHRCRY